MGFGDIGAGPYGIGLAFLAGLLSFLSPCVFALVPAYIGYLSGRSFNAEGEFVENRWVTFTHGLFFVAGFSVIFVILGAAASAVGVLLYDLRVWLARIGGVVVIIFGLHTLGVINLPFLNYDTRRQVDQNSGLTYMSSFMMGVFFSAGWAPCVGPVLGAILTLAMNNAMISDGIILLSAYSLGLAVPFLITALGIGWVSEILKKYNKAARYISYATGILLIIVGVMLFTGTLERLARFGFFVDFGL